MVILFKIAGGAMILGGDAAGMADWEASNPVEQEVFLLIGSGIYQFANGAAELVLSVGGGGGGATITVLNTDAPLSGNTYTSPALVGKTLKSVLRDGIGVRITPTPQDGAISFNSGTGTLELGANDVFGGEWLQIIYE